MAYFEELNFKDMVKKAITNETIELPLHLLANELPILTSGTKVPKKIAVACSDKEDQQDLDPENTSENENKICDKDQDANQSGYISGDKEDQQDLDPENTSENENKICDKDQDANQSGYVSDHDDSVTEGYYSEDDEE